MCKAKLNIPMCAALILLFLTMISIHLTSGLYARYVATATGSDSVRVAKFDVTGSGSDAVTVDCRDSDNSGKYLITVTSNSEVTVRYTITVTFEESISATDMTVMLDGSPLNGNKLVLTNTLAPNADPAPHTLTFLMTNWSAVSHHTTGATASKTLNFHVNIDVQQVD